jgi:CheY-like chemotaxis protein
VDINALLRNVAQLLQRSLRADIEISLELEAGVWQVLADPGQIEAAVTNLAANARDAMPQGGRIRISTANQQVTAEQAEAAPDGPAGDYVVIGVADTGGGIPAEILPHVFEPFFTTKPPGEGTGLGLAMVFGFVRQSEGFVRLVTAPGEGTTFRLFLPRAKGVDSRALPAELADTPPRGSETVLVAEDNVQLRGIMAQQLIALGYQVLEAADGPAALRLLERAAVDLLITDVTMPGGMTGFDLAREARILLPGLPVLIASAQSEGVGGERLDLPVLHKPFRAMELARAVREALKG